MTRYDFEIVPQVALDSRYNDHVQIFTFRTNERDVINSLFHKLQTQLNATPDQRFIFWLFDFASRHHAAPSYWKQRLEKLSGAGIGEANGRIAVATQRSLNSLLSANSAVSGLEAAFPHVEFRGFFKRDDAIAWLIAGYERATLRAN